jgi:hypothetical protein
MEEHVDFDTIVHTVLIHERSRPDFIFNAGCGYA